MKNRNSYLIIIYILTALLFFSQCSEKKNGSGDRIDRVFYPLNTFCMGADLSFANELLEKGGVYLDSGKPSDPYTIFKNHGCNLVRVRLWHTPSWTMGTGTKMYSDLKDAGLTIKKAREAGMAVNLDIHYSDTWADPSRQEMPAAWRNAPFELLLDSVYNYTYNVLTYLGGKNLMPEMVQIGNEINQGMLFPYGNIATSGWDKLGLLLNSGIKAVRDASASSSVKPQIILHVAQPEHVQNWITNITGKGGVTDFDIIGMSYYSKWSTVPLSQLGINILGITESFHKKVMVVETAYSWTPEGNDSYNNIFSSSDADPLYPQTVEGQYNYLVALAKQVIIGKGAGVQYWAPDYISTSRKDQWGTGSPWENNTFFDFDGNVIKGIDYMTYPYAGLEKK